MPCSTCSSETKVDLSTYRFGSKWTEYVGRTYGKGEGGGKAPGRVQHVEFMKG